MVFKIFEKGNLLLTEKNGLSTLYACHQDFSQNGISVKTLAFAHDLPFIEVNDEAELIITPSDVYSFNLEKVLHFKSIRPSVIKLEGMFIVVSDVYNDPNNVTPIRLFLWNGTSEVMDTVCYEIRYSKDYFALRHDNDWKIYSSSGQRVRLPKEVSSKCDIEFYKYFLVSKHDGKSDVFNLLDVSLVCENVVSPIVSAHEYFVAVHNGKSLDVYHIGKSTHFDDVDECIIINEEKQLFCIRKNRKYFIYTFACKECSEFAFGVDFVSFNEEYKSLLLLNNDLAYFYSQN